MAPELVTVALAPMPTPTPKMPTPFAPVPEMAPKFVTEPVLKAIPLLIKPPLPVTVAPWTTVVLRLISLPLPKPLGGFWLRVVPVQVAVTLLPASGSHLA
jgi:hypothetical protein